MIRKIAYGSQVALVLTKDADANLRDLVRLHLDELLKEEFRDLAETSGERLISRDGRFVLYHCWHAPSAAVQWLLSQLLTLEPPTWGLWRLGENAEDSEWLGQMQETPFELDLHRELVFNRPRDLT